MGLQHELAHIDPAKFNREADALIIDIDPDELLKLGIGEMADRYPVIFDTNERIAMALAEQGLQEVVASAILAGANILALLLIRYAEAEELPPLDDD